MSVPRQARVRPARGKPAQSGCAAARRAAGGTHVSQTYLKPFVYWAAAALKSPALNAVVPAALHFSASTIFSAVSILPTSLAQPKSSTSKFSVAPAGMVGGLPLAVGVDDDSEVTFTHFYG